MKPKSEANGHAMPAPSCEGKRFAIVAARFYRELTDAMIDGAKRALAQSGVADDDVLVFDVPGCFELPLACKNIIARENVDGI
ncbi:MAG TPA: 6,7-dimethyl-8-ribityllumazine synthase, partial [Candidatus Aquilonibacter sp.]|nr:6,7-dimethyl-8-ribityllumazine synthase [Candidatus Aquilonibacter sp.]